LPDLSTKLKVPPAYLKRKLRYWQARRVIREVKPDYYQQFETVNDWLRADRECFSSIPTIAYYDNDDEVERECAAETGRTKMDAFWSYIVGMLTNIKALSLNRIHSMLKMFAMQEASAEECTVEELKEYLQAKVCNQELMYTGSVFRLPPPQ
jgi:anaphase-promoting complex subunit 2